MTTAPASHPSWCDPTLCWIVDAGTPDTITTHARKLPTLTLSEAVEASGTVHRTILPDFSELNDEDGALVASAEDLLHDAEAALAWAREVAGQH